jgi:hypothetical protein
MPKVSSIQRSTTATAAASDRLAVLNQRLLIGVAAFGLWAVTILALQAMSAYQRATPGGDGRVIYQLDR